MGMWCVCYSFFPPFPSFRLFSGLSSRHFYLDETCALCIRCEQVRPCSSHFYSALFRFTLFFILTAFFGWGCFVLTLVPLSLCDALSMVSATSNGFYVSHPRQGRRKIWIKSKYAANNLDSLFPVCPFSSRLPSRLSTHVRTDTLGRRSVQAHDVI